MAPTGNAAPVPPIRRLQILAISIVGALAVLSYAAATLLGGASADLLQNIAGVLGIFCAVIGVSFAVVGNQR